MALLSLGAACASTAPKSAKRPASPPAPALHEGPLTDYVPAAGLRWMLVGKPERIAKSRAFADALAQLLPAERLRAFEQGTGIDLARVPEGVIAGFDLGHLYLFTPPPGSAESVLRHFAESHERAKIESPHPSIRRLTGISGNVPHALVRIDEKLIAIAARDLTLGRVVEAFARKKLARSPPALRGAALSALVPPAPEAVATFYAPGPFEGEWARAARGLLADAVALSISVTPARDHTARFTVQVAGDLPPPARDELVAAYRDLAVSSTGKLLGLDVPTAPPVLREREGRLEMDIEIDLRPVARGLRAAVIADVWEIMELPPPKHD